LPSCARASAARGGSSGLEEAVQLVAIAALGGDLLAHPRRFLLQLLQIAFELLDAEQVEIQRTRARPARLEIIAVHEGLLSQLTHEQLGSLRGFTQGVDHFARNWPQPFEGGLLPPGLPGRITLPVPERLRQAGRTVPGRKKQETADWRRKP